MPLPDILRRFDRLDENSPQFPDQPTSLYNEGLKYCILKLRKEDVVWLVKYLDQVCLSIALYPHSAQPA